MHIHASPNGKEISTDDPINTHHYTAPEAYWGWDSDLESFYFGYTFYNISVHNPQNKLDLPLFITIEKASRHDVLTSISACAQLLDINPEIKPKYVCLDSASDSISIYQYFIKKGIIPVIDRNKRAKGNTSAPLADSEYINENGVFVCSCGQEMVYAVTIILVIERNLDAY